MAKHTALNKKRLIASLLVAAIMLSIIPITALGADYIGHWAEDSIDRAVSMGWFADADATRPDAPVTRAEFVTMINRMKGYSGSADLSAYSDISPDDWFYSAFATAVANGFIQGSYGLLSPNAYITRNEAVTIFTRISGIDVTAENAAALDNVGDAASIPDWALPYAKAAVTNGLIAGSNGEFNGNSNITRAETAVLLERLYDDIRTYGFAGTYSGAASSVIVLASGVNLTDMNIRGDLTIAESVGNGDVTFTGVNVSGKLNVNGGGSNSVYISGGNIAEIIVNKKSVHIVISDATVVTSMTVAAENASIDLGSGASVKTLGVTETAKGTIIATESGSTIGTVTISAVGTQITGSGSIETANIKASGVEIEQKPTKTNVDDGISAEVGGKIVKGSDSGSSGGGGGGGGNWGGDDDDDDDDKDVKVTSLSLDKSEVIITVDDTAVVKATVAPADAKNKTITWTSSDRAVAEVDNNGKITGKAVGRTVVEAKTADGGFTALVDVQVEAHVITASVTGETYTGDVIIRVGDKDIELENVKFNGNITIEDAEAEDASVQVFTFASVARMLSIAAQAPVMSALDSEPPANEPFAAAKGGVKFKGNTSAKSVEVNAEREITTEKGTEVERFNTKKNASMNLAGTVNKIDVGSNVTLKKLTVAEDANPEVTGGGTVDDVEIKASEGNKTVGLTISTNVNNVAVTSDNSGGGENKPSIGTLNIGGNNTNTKINIKEVEVDRVIITDTAAPIINVDNSKIETITALSTSKREQTRIEGNGEINKLQVLQDETDSGDEEKFDTLVFDNNFVGGKPDPVPVVPELTGLVITAAPVKNRYLVGETFDSSGMRISGVYTIDGAAPYRSEIRSYTILIGGKAFEGVAFADADIGTRIVEVSVTGVTPVEFEITVRADKTALVSAIAAAKSAISLVVVSADGTDVEPGIGWVTPAVKNTINAAIVSAEASNANPAITSEDVDTAVETLNDAAGVFKAAIRNDGTFGEIDKSELAGILANARTMADSTVTSSAEGKDLVPGLYWVTPNRMQILRNAITAANDVFRSSDATQDDIDKQTASLETELETFIEKRTGPTNTDTEALGKAIEAAGDAKEGIRPSDGNDVTGTEKWATPNEFAALNNAITAAQAVLDNPKASQIETDNAAGELNKAIEIFKNQIKSTQVDPTPLENAIEAAKAARDAVEISADGKNVDPSKLWVTSEALDVLNAAITVADELFKGGGLTQNKVASASAVLRSAMLTFNAERKAGLKALESIAVTTPPTKVTYTTGEMFDKTGMVVTATYSDGTTKAVTDYTITPSAALTVDDKSVTISYTEGGVTKTVAQTINVTAAAVTLESIAVTTPPTKTEYIEGEIFDPAGMVITATYSDESTIAVTGYTVTPTAALTVNDKSVTISYTEGGVTKTVAQEINVTAAAVTLESIAVTTPPTKTEYFEGETFDPAGMVITATYSDESTIAVTGYTVTPTAALTVNDKSVTISYTEGTVTKTATQAINVTARTYTTTVDKNALTPNTAQQGYTTIAGTVFTVTNTGNTDISDLVIKLSDGSKFDIAYNGTDYSAGALLAPSASTTITVTPKTGLAVGEHTVNLTVSSAAHPTADKSVALKFTVTAIPVSLTGLTITPTQTGLAALTLSPAFSAAVTAYTAVAANGAGEVKVAIEGSGISIGSITRGGTDVKAANAGSGFTLAYGTNVIIVTVIPTAGGDPIGTYTITVTRAQHAITPAANAYNAITIKLTGSGNMAGTFTTPLNLNDFIISGQTALTESNAWYINRVDDKTVILALQGAVKLANASTTVTLLQTALSAGSTGVTTVEITAGNYYAIGGKLTVSSGITGVSAAGKEIQLYASNGTTLIDTVMTDASGNFTLPGLYASGLEYRLNVKGYPNSVTNVTTLSGHVANAAVTLKLTALAAPAASFSGNGNVTWTDTGNAAITGVTYDVELYKGNETNPVHTYHDLTNGAVGINVLTDMHTSAGGTQTSFKVKVVAKAPGYTSAASAASGALNISSVKAVSSVQYSSSTVTWMLGSAGEAPYKYIVRIYRAVGSAEPVVVKTYYAANTTSQNISDFMSGAEHKQSGKYTVTVQPMAQRNGGTGEQSGLSGEYVTLAYDGTEPTSAADIDTVVGDVYLNLTTEGLPGTAPAWTVAPMFDRASGQQVKTGTSNNIIASSGVVRSGTSDVFGSTYTGYMVTGWTLTGNTAGTAIAAGAHASGTHQLLTVGSSQATGSTLTLKATYTNTGVYVAPYIIGGNGERGNIVDLSAGVDMVEGTGNTVYFVTKLKQFSFKDNTRGGVGGGNIDQFTYVRKDTPGTGDTAEVMWEVIAEVSTYTGLESAVNNTTNDPMIKAIDSVHITKNITGQSTNVFKFSDANLKRSGKHLTIAGRGNGIDFGLFFGTVSNVTVENLVITIPGTGLDKCATSSQNDGSVPSAVLFESGSNIKLDHVTISLTTENSNEPRRQAVYVGQAVTGSITITGSNIQVHTPAGIQRDGNDAAIYIAPGAFDNVIITNNTLGGTRALVMNFLGQSATLNDTTKDNIKNNTYVRTSNNALVPCDVGIYNLVGYEASNGAALNNQGFAQLFGTSTSGKHFTYSNITRLGAFIENLSGKENGFVMYLPSSASGKVLSQGILTYTASSDTWSVTNYKNADIGISQATYNAYTGTLVVTTTGTVPENATVVVNKFVLGGVVRLDVNRGGAYQSNSGLDSAGDWYWDTDDNKLTIVLTDADKTTVNGFLSESTKFIADDGWGTVENDSIAAGVSKDLTVESFNDTGISTAAYNPTTGVLTFTTTGTKPEDAVVSLRSEAGFLISSACWIIDMDAEPGAVFTEVKDNTATAPNTWSWIGDELTICLSDAFKNRINGWMVSTGLSSFVIEGVNGWHTANNYTDAVPTGKLDLQIEGDKFNVTFAKQGSEYYKDTGILKIKTTDNMPEGSNVDVTKIVIIGTTDPGGGASVVLTGRVAEVEKGYQKAESVDVEAGQWFWEGDIITIKLTGTDASIVNARNPADGGYLHTIASWSTATGYSDAFHVEVPVGLTVFENTPGEEDNGSDAGLNEDDGDEGDSEPVA